MRFYTSIWVFFMALISIPLGLTGLFGIVEEDSLLVGLMCTGIALFMFCPYAYRNVWVATDRGIWAAGRFVPAGEMSRVMVVDSSVSSPVPAWSLMLEGGGDEVEGLAFVMARNARRTGRRISDRYGIEFVDHSNEEPVSTGPPRRALLEPDQVGRRAASQVDQPVESRAAVPAELRRKGRLLQLGTIALGALGAFGLWLGGPSVWSIIGGVLFVVGGFVLGHFVRKTAEKG